MHGGLLCVTLLLSVCPSVCDWTEIHWTIIHISGSLGPRSMKLVCFFKKKQVGSRQRQVAFFIFFMANTMANNK